MSGLTNLMLAIPSLVFALAIMAILGPGLVSLVIALGLTSWSYSCRIARAQVLSLKSQGYVQAARILGYGDLRIMFTQVLPNILGPLIVIATLGMGGAILAEAALSFLGLGIRPPFPSWGSMLSEARDQIRTVPWLSVFRKSHPSACRRTIRRKAPEKSNRMPRCRSPEGCWLEWHNPPYTQRDWGHKRDCKVRWLPWRPKAQKRNPCAESDSLI